MDALVGGLGLLDRPFDIQALIRRARERTGHADFGDADFGPGLAVLLEACAREAALSVVGRSATGWDVVRFLSNLLRLQAIETADPSVTAEPIAAPLLITGLPRSGTTFLHRLLMADPANRAPLVWETIHPCPPAGQDAARIALVDRQLQIFERLAPGFRALHPLEAVSPQECSEVTAHLFTSLRFDTNYQIPSYRAWLDAHAERPFAAYRFHRRFLQHLQARDRRADAAAGLPRQWVLKCPEHVFALPAIQAVYPDARMVFVHRDPLRVLLSVAELTEVLRRPFTRRLDPMSIGQSESARWLEGTRRMMAAGADAGFARPVCHVQYRALVADPVGTARRVYAHFGMELTASGAAAMADYVAAQPDGGYARHDYRLADHGLEEAAERERFRPYMEHFDIAAEPLAARASQPRTAMSARPIDAPAPG
jgi:hypothetical protein